jgi:CO/xanthine dehydrogenase Mo-binding subunit
MNAAVPRGFTFDRNDGKPVLPGNLHTNRKLSHWLDFSQQGLVRVFTGKVELGQGILTALSIIAADELDVRLDQVQPEPSRKVHPRVSAREVGHSRELP